MDRIRNLILTLLLLTTTGCHSLNRIDPSGNKGPLAGTSAALTVVGEGTSGALIGRNFDGEEIPVSERGMYAGMGVFATAALPFAFMMDVINGPTN